jgi:hypothetical protein
MDSLKNENKEKEIIAEILKEQRKQKSSTDNPHTIQKDKWVTFTYFGPCVRTITKLFRNSNVNVDQKYNKIPCKNKRYNSLSGVYQMKCKDFPLRYIGQTGLTFRTRYTNISEKYEQMGKVQNSPSRC